MGLSGAGRCDVMANIDFRNVDLEIESLQPVDEIIDVLGQDVLVLHSNVSRRPYTASFELSQSIGSPEAVISEFCTLIENLPSSARKIWDACVSKTFDIGYSSGDQSSSFQSFIHSNTLIRMSKLNISLNITIYPMSTDHGLPKDCVNDRY